MTSHGAPTPGLHPSTIAVSLGRDPRPGAPLNVPPTFASTYRDGGDIGYGRYGNPTWSALEDTLGALEAGTAVLFASGQAATNAVLGTVPNGGTVALVDGSYLGTRALTARSSDRFTVRTVPVGTAEARDPEAVLHVAQGADLLWLESPTNPLLDVLDLARLLPEAARLGIRTVVDNTFATPLLQNPLTLGAWAVTHSATKFISGHSDAVLGAVVTRDEVALERLRQHRGLTGAIPGTMETYLVLRGLRTLPVRVERAQATAALLAQRLGGHPTVQHVRYPGWGAMVSFVLRDADTADRAIEALRIVVGGTSLGGVETTVDRRRRWVGEEAVPEGLIRMSVGLEHPDDLWSDLAQALDRAATDPVG